MDGSAAAFLDASGDDLERDAAEGGCLRERMKAETPVDRVKPVMLVKPLLE